jgi:hypothetical protein
MQKVDPRVCYAAERPDGLGIVVWRPDERQVALGILRNGEMVATFPLANVNAAELCVELMGANLGELEKLAAELPAEICIRLAGALLGPHRKEIVGAAAIVARAMNLERETALGIA